ncbi:rhodanese-like domain-containing protein [Flavobacterium arcticum]|uniref:Rhodanese-like domain-containing protein n=1 Tax=Flavobacterium arcticum TaxID=1784713 RepID=A0A345H8H9_9FLAO|nr:rhodanese-like domain-containing protein [Flavobacterium arcticum]AXG72889.1 rhodanese-like domain-containing protein [Flavobacterium arcticum]KAF2510447.1 rhodanese-like domain-containing protein [Flavobacterium arcticum]
MKKIIYFFTLLLIIVSCNEPRKQSVTLVKPTVFYEKMAEHKGQVVDVRTTEEYQRGHLKEAVNIHLYDKDFEQRIEELDKEKPVYVYCKVGGRSAEAVKIMKEKGFNSIVELDGGIDAWTDAKKPVIK